MECDPICTGRAVLDELGEPRDAGPERRFADPVSNAATVGGDAATGRETT